MAQIAGRRMTAEVDGDFVVFLIGARPSKLRDRTGIWHETFQVRAGEYEAVYGNMPPVGLGKIGRLVPVSESSSARERIKAMAAGPTDNAPS